MFIAVVIPPAKRERPLLLFILAVMAVSAAASVCPLTKDLSSGMRIMIITILTSRGSGMLYSKQTGGLQWSITYTCIFLLWRWLPTLCGPLPLLFIRREISNPTIRLFFPLCTVCHSNRYEPSPRLWKPRPLPGFRTFIAGSRCISCLERRRPADSLCRLLCCSVYMWKKVSSFL